MQTEDCRNRQSSVRFGIAGHAMTFLYGSSQSLCPHGRAIVYLIMHILGMASIDDCYCITLDDVGEVPFICICHMVV